LRPPDVLGSPYLAGVPAVEVVALRSSPEVIAALADVLVETVASGGSVSFMHPLPAERARRFWTDSLAAASRGERVVLGARRDGRLVATVTLHLDCPENQPHRGEIAKLLVRRSARGRGIARRLMERAESEARAEGKTLLVLDTVTGGEAERLYRRLGWQSVGVIPGYALWPRGGLCSTTFFYRDLA
jgi:GNAT superfamily N-acetyltransferase